MFAFEEIICAVKVANRGVPFHHVIAVNKQMLHVCIEIVMENIQMSENVMVVKIILHSIVGVDSVVGSPFRPGIQNPTIGKKPVNVIAWESDLPISQYCFKEFLQIKRLVDPLKHKVANILHLRLGCDISGSNQLLIEVDFELNLSLAFLVLPIILLDLFLGIRQGIVSDGKQFRMLSDPLHVLRGDFLSVPDTLLNEIGGILGLAIVPKLHTTTPPVEIQSYYTTSC